MELTIAQANSILLEAGYSNIRFDMGDAHAQYYIAKHSGSAMEIKFVHDTGEMAFRNLGDEDWCTEKWVKECENDICGNILDDEHDVICASCTQYMEHDEF